MRYARLSRADLVVLLLAGGLGAWVVYPLSRASWLTAAQLQCANNVKHLMLGLAMYSSEGYYGHLPFSGRREVADSADLRASDLGLLYYFGHEMVRDARSFRCPLDADWRPPYPGTINRDPECSYGYWEMVDVTAPAKKWNLNASSRTSAPANAVLVADEPLRGGPNGEVGRGGKFHARGQNLGFKDSHVKFYETDWILDDQDPGSIYIKDSPFEMDNWIR